MGSEMTISFYWVNQHKNALKEFVEKRYHNYMKQLWDY